MLWFQEKVEVLEYHSESVNSSTESYRLPSVIQLKRYVKTSFTRQVRLNRQNIFLRDDYRCQYCHKVFPPKQLTIDHVMPLSRGGQHVWHNVASSCSKCNNRKGSKTVAEARLNIFKKPVRPKWLPSRALAMNRRVMPKEWAGYLSHLKGFDSYE